MSRRRRGNDREDTPVDIAQERLTAWCNWHHEQHFALTPGGKTMEVRLMEANFDRFRTLNLGWWRKLWRKTDHHMPCKETRSASGDGGMGAFVDRAYESIRWDKECRQVQDAYDAMSVEMRRVVQARYVGHFRDLPRSFAKAGEILELADSTYWEQHRAMLQWLAERLGLVEKKAA